ncbi:hypothetical protein, partial [Bacteroides fragilis]|uniref:hypothetical protein n=1 Tax=Bacteroides fragilis TaxID=817 RepID=UPI00227C3461
IALCIFNSHSGRLIFASAHPFFICFLSVQAQYPPKRLCPVTTSDFSCRRRNLLIERFHLLYLYALK